MLWKWLLKPYRLNRKVLSQPKLRLFRGILTMSLLFFGLSPFMANYLNPNYIHADTPTITWIGGGDGFSWNDPANWSTDAIPSTTDVPSITSGTFLLIRAESNITISGLEINSSDITLSLNGYDLTITNDFDNSGYVDDTPLLSIGGNLNNASTGTITVDSGEVEVGGLTTNSGNIIVSTGLIDLTDVDNSYNIKANGTGSINITGDITNTGNITTTATGTITLSGNINNQNGNIVQVGAGNINISGPIINNDNGNIDTASGDIVTTNTVDNQNGNIETTGGYISLGGDANNNGGTLLTGANNISVNGTVDNTTGNISTEGACSSIVNVSYFFNGNIGYKLDAGGGCAGGNIAISGATNNYEGNILTKGTGFITIGGDTNNNVGNVDCADGGYITITGNVTNTDGNVKCTGNSPITINGNDSNDSGNIMSGTGDIYITGTVDSTVGSEILTANNVTIGSTVTNDGSLIQSDSGDISIHGLVNNIDDSAIGNATAGDIYLYDGLSEDYSSVSAYNNLTIDGTLLNQDYGYIYNFGDTGDLVVNGDTTNETGSSIDVQVSGSGNLDFNGNVINSDGGGIYTNTTGGQINVTGLLENITPDNSAPFPSQLFGTDGDWHFGSLNNDANSEVAAPTGTLYISQDFSNYINDTNNNDPAYFDPDGGTVSFNGGGSSEIDGSSTFNNFSAAPGTTLVFQAGTTQTIDGIFNLTGSPSNLINIRSTASPTQATVDPEGTLAVSYVDVQDNINVSTIYNYIDPADSVDSGNTVRWFSTHIITAATQGSGSINPTGIVTVDDLSNQSFTIAPASGNLISNVVVDGTNDGAISSYTFNNITGPHTITAIFIPINIPKPPAPVKSPPSSSPTNPTVPVTTSPTSPTSTPTTTPTTTTSNPTTTSTNSNFSNTPTVHNRSLLQSGFHYIQVLFTHVPAPIAVGFPWLLLLLLLLMVLWTIRQARRESYQVKVRTRLLKEMKQLAEAKNIFLELAAHYLRTPLSKLSGGVELLESLNPNLAILAELKSQTSQIKFNAEQVLQKVTSNQPVQSISAPTVSSSEVKIKLARRLWIFTGFIGVLGVLIDFIIRNYKHLHTSTVTYATQIALYALLSLVLYGVLRTYRLQHQRRVALVNEFNQQQSLDNARISFIADIYNHLIQPLQSLNKITQNLSGSTPAGRSILNGLSEYQVLCTKIKTVIDLNASNLADNYYQLNLHTVINDAIQHLMSNINAKHLAINGVSDLSELNVIADSGLISQVITAVLSNAVKFSSDDGTIELYYHTTRHSLSFMVQDHGKGIDPVYLSRLFQPFSRAQASALDFSYEGIGLSLYVAKLIMQSLHGDLNLVSEPGKGTLVTIQLPRADGAKENAFGHFRLATNASPA